MLNSTLSFSDVVDSFVFDHYDDSVATDDEEECDFFLPSRSLNRITNYQFRSFVQVREEMRSISAPNVLSNQLISFMDDDFADVVDEMIEDDDSGDENTSDLTCKMDKNRFNWMVNKIRNRSWDVDVFDFELLVSDPVLVTMGSIIFQSYPEFQAFLPKQNKLKAFLTLVTEHYHPAPYHNSQHAADVLHSVHCLVKNIVNQIEPWKLYALFLAAILIDVGHVGISNRCLKDSNHEIYQHHAKSRSPMEAMHADLGRRLLEQSGILDSLPLDLCQSVKEMVEELILGTDLAYPPENNPQDHVALYILCAADVGKSTKRYAIHSVWTERLTEEFIRQGDSQALEYQLPNAVTRKVKIAYVRSYFLQNRVLPLYQTLEHRFNIDIKEQLEILDQHLAHWQGQL